MPDKSLRDEPLSLSRSWSALDRIRRFAATDLPTTVVVTWMMLVGPGQTAWSQTPGYGGTQPQRWSQPLPGQELRRDQLAVTNSLPYGPPVWQARPHQPARASRPAERRVYHVTEEGVLLPKKVYLQVRCSMRLAPYILTHPSAFCPFCHSPTGRGLTKNRSLWLVSGRLGDNSFNCPHNDCIASV